MKPPMGTDIHAHFEVFQADQWVHVQVLPNIKNGDDLTQEEEQAHWNLPLFMDRDPELFAVLAGVNNHFGIQPIMSEDVKSVDRRCLDQAA